MALLVVLKRWRKAPLLQKVIKVYLLLSDYSSCRAGAQQGSSSSCCCCRCSQATNTKFKEGLQSTGNTLWLFVCVFAVLQIFCGGFNLFYPPDNTFLFFVLLFYYFIQQNHLYEHWRQKPDVCVCLWVFCLLCKWYSRVPNFLELLVDPLREYWI